MTKPKLIQGGLKTDERGIVSFVNDFAFKDVKRFYLVENHRRGFIRAWHGHKKEGKYIFVAQGVALVGAVNMNTEEKTQFVLNSKSPSILWIPPGYANGFQNLEDNTKIIFFSTKTVQESEDDDIRFPYDKWNIWTENL